MICLTACGRVIPYNSEENNPQTVYSESVEKTVEDTSVTGDINTAIEEKKKELDDISGNPFGIAESYMCTMFDYNNDSHEDYVILYVLYAQFELVVFDSQNLNILLENRVMMDLFSETEIQIYRNSDSEYLFRISDQIFRPNVPNMVETIQFITEFGDNILEAVYDSDTNSFHNGWFNYSGKDYNYDEYTKKQEELLKGYDYYMDLEFEIYEKYL